MTAVETRLRDLAPQVLGVLVRRHGDFARCEDALQEALLAAARQWPQDGLPENPKGWLITVASRRWTELWRSDGARARREETAAALEPPAPPDATGEEADDSISLLLLCCHDSLTLPSQVALTLRAVGGLTTAEIARALLLPEATVAQRISRAKQRIRAAGGSFAPPPAAELRARLDAVLRVLYLIFTEGSTASSGAGLHRVELSSEAIRLTRQLHCERPRDGEIAGLLALMVLTDARRPARARADGTLVPLAEQDRALWDRASIAEGIGVVSSALTDAPLGPFQLQAAIAAVHAEAARVEDTDWPQILGLYELLHRLEPGPMTALGRIVAIAMVQGAATGLRELDAAAAAPVLAGHHRTHAVRAHLLELTGAHAAARAAFGEAARRTLSIPERRYLTAKSQRDQGARLMTAPREPRVDEYIEALPAWQQAVCREVRDLVHAADPEVQETIKRRVQPYFVLEGNVCALLAAKQHVCVFLYDGAIVPDPERIITDGHGNTSARQISIHEGETINAPALQAMFAQIIANNRAGGWRRLKAAGRDGVENRGAASTPK